MVVSEVGFSKGFPCETSIRGTPDAFSRLLRSEDGTKSDMKTKIEEHDIVFMNDVATVVCMCMLNQKDAFGEAF